MYNFFLKFIIIAHAQTPPDITQIIFPTSKFTNPQDIIVGIINRMLEIGSVLAVIALIYSGIMYITASGDTAKADTAKKNITWAIIGIVVIILSLAIVNWVNDIVNGAF